MSFPVESFWKLVVESSLMSLDDCHRYHAAWVAQNPQGDAQQLAEWLFAQNVISRYQASILLAGRPGPFLYGDYKIYDRIETGRLKGIFRAVHTTTNHPVCLQFLTAEQAATPERVAQLIQQANLVSRSSAGFPHLLRCYQLVDLGPYKFFVLEDLQGKRIERILAKEGPRPQSEACSVARQIAAGLGRLHAMHQAHGDVRPANIWVDAAGTVKLMQFPLSRNPLAAPIDWKAIVAASSAAVPPEADFIAPELIAGGKPDVRSDIYQLGCSLYTMLTNQVPFPSKSLRDKLEGHLKQTPPPIEQINPSISPALAKVVGYMMQKKPELRYQQVATVIEKLLPFMTPVDAQSQPTPPTRAAQMYDAWLHERLAAAATQSSPPPAPQQQPFAAQPVMAATLAPQQAMAAHPMSPSPGVASPYTAAVAATPHPGYPQQTAAYGQPAFGGPMHAAPAASPYAPGNSFGSMPEPEPQPAPGPSAAAAPSFSGSGPTAPGRAGAAPSFATSLPPSSKSNSSTLFAGAVVATLLVVGGGIAWLKFGSGKTDLTVTSSAGVKPPVATPKGTASGTKVPVATPTATAEVKPVEPPQPKGNVIPVRDTLTGLGDPLWDSPTSGKQLDLSHLCRGASLVAAVRPADLMKHAESERLLDEKVLGAIAPWYQTTLPQWAGVAHDQIEQVIVGVLDGPAPRYSCVIRLKQPAAEDQLLQIWGNPAAEQLEDAKFYVKENLAFYLPAAGQGKVVVVAPKEEMADLLMLKGAPAQLAPRELNVLLQSTDADRHLSVVFSPHFLETGGKPLVAGTFERGVAAMNWLFTGFGLPALGDTGTPPPAMANESEPPKAALFSAHLASNGAVDDIFWEARIYQPSANSISESAAAPLASRVKEIGSRVEQYYISLSASPYSKAILYKFPPMVKFFCNNVRTAVGDKQFVLRGTGPDVAAHNIVLGARLCLFETPGAYVASGPTGGTPGGTTGPAKQMGVLDALRTKKMMLSFDRNDLNKVLDIVATELGFPIEMHGDDFRAAGITKNQSMGLMEPEQTLDKLLQVILKKANMDGQLVYTAKTDPDGSEKLLILTRKGATDRKEQLPPEFAAPK